MAIWTRLAAWSFVSRWVTWDLTVATETNCSAAISAFVLPSAMAKGDIALARGQRVDQGHCLGMARVWVGRDDGPDESLGHRRREHRVSGVDAVDRLDDERRGVSLRRNPLAPARSAPRTRSSASKVVSTMIAGGAGRAMICAVAVSPSTTGIRMSMSTTSGRCSRMAAGASAPSLTSPTTFAGGAAEHEAQPGTHESVVIDDQDPDLVPISAHRLTPSHGRDARTR